MDRRRLWALASLLLAVAAVAVAVAVAIVRFPRGLTVLACIVVAALAGWYAVRRRGWPRRAAGALAALLVAGAVTLVVIEGKVIADVVIVVAALGALAAAREAFTSHVHLQPADRPQRPVLFYNPKSGGGKAERFRLAEEARRRGIEPRELARGDDLEELVREAVKQGADGLAMAGGDGSQAIVAKIASELDLPYACIPPGRATISRSTSAWTATTLWGRSTRSSTGASARWTWRRSTGACSSTTCRSVCTRKPFRRRATATPSSARCSRRCQTRSGRPRIRRSSAGTGRTDARRGRVLVSNNRYRLGKAIGSGTRPTSIAGLGIAVLNPPGEQPDGAHASRLGSSSGPISGSGSRPRSRSRPASTARRPCSSRRCGSAP